MAAPRTVLTAMAPPRRNYDVVIVSQPWWLLKKGMNGREQWHDADNLALNFDLSTL